MLTVVEVYWFGEIRRYSATARREVCMRKYPPNHTEIWIVGRPPVNEYIRILVQPHFLEGDNPQALPCIECGSDGRPFLLPRRGRRPRLEETNEIFFSPTAG